MMKGRNRKRRGFTLVELLVTMGVIAIVAAMLVGGISLAIQKGAKSRAQVEVATIASACQAYFDEYGVWPTFDTNGWPDGTFGGKGNNETLNKQMREVMDILRARPTSVNLNHSNNIRRIVFIEIPVDAMTGTDVEGWSYTENEGYYLDPWGNPYVICLDNDFDGEVGIAGIEGGGSGNAFNDLARSGRVVDKFSGVIVIPGTRVAVISYGPGYTANNTVASNSVIFSWGKL